MGKLKQYYQNQTPGFVALVLFGYGLLIRLPFFFRDYVDRDESTFILMGQSWVDGFLPYTQLWDVKPPLTFLFFAGVIYLFGKSFIAIRLFGVILVTISSFFSYKLALHICSKRVALGVGFLSVILQSLFGSLQGVMSEHIVMAVLMPALWLLAIPDGKNKNWLYAGLLMGCALMVKLNVAYVALLIGIFALFQLVDKGKVRFNLWRAILYGTGALIIILAVTFPYYLEHQLALWWKSVVMAPLAYAGQRQDSSIKMVAFIAPLAIFLLWGFYKKRFTLTNSTVGILVLATLGTLIAFVKGGRINGHYLILLYPILLPLLAMSIDKVSILWRKRTPIVMVLLLILIPVESYLEYANVIKNKMEKGSFFNGEGVDVPNYLLENGIETKNIFFAEYHIGYWLLGQNPPTKAATQPSNVLKDEMFFAYENPRKTGLEELQYIMEELKPDIVVARSRTRLFDGRQVEANKYIDAYLAKNYQLIETIDRGLIYQRLK